MPGRVAPWQEDHGAGSGWFASLLSERRNAQEEARSTRRRSWRRCRSQQESAHKVVGCKTGTGDLMMIQCRAQFHAMFARHSAALSPRTLCFAMAAEPEAQKNVAYWKAVAEAKDAEFQELAAGSAELEQMLEAELQAAHEQLTNKDDAVQRLERQLDDERASKASVLREMAQQQVRRSCRRSQRLRSNHSPQAELQKLQTAHAKLSEQVTSLETQLDQSTQQHRAADAALQSSVAAAEAAREETILAQLELETQQQEAQEALEVCVRACVAYDCCATGVSHASARGTSD